MTTRVEAEEIRQTPSERVLAIVLGVFIFVGLVWGYVKLAEVNEPARSTLGPGAPQLSEEQQAAIAEANQAAAELRDARSADRRAFAELTLRREEYRTALDAGTPAAELRAAYLSAQATLRESAQRLAVARERVAAARGPAAEAERSRQAAINAEQDAHDRTVLVLRLGLILAMAGGGFWAMARLRSRRSRYLPLTLAWLTTSALMGVVLVADYSWEEFTTISDLGPLVLSIAGGVMTLVAFIALQRYLLQRLPVRRLGRGECPFCGFKATGDGEHCEGCGRTLIGECATCHRSRRVGAPHCAACGAP
jgi:hypothetical protein